MANDLEVIQSRVDAPQVNIQAPDLSKLGQAATALGAVAQQAFQDVNLIEQRKAGEAQALAGTAKKNLLPGFGAAQREFNKAVADTEARQLARDAKHMMMDAYVAASDPEKFNADTPGKFMEVVQGISQGVFSNARDENRAQVAGAINETADHFAGLMLKDTQKWQNAEMIAMVNEEITETMTAREEAIISGDTAGAASLKVRLDKIMADYSSMSNSVRLQMPELKKKIELADKTNEIIAEYVKASENGTGGTFLIDFMSRRREGLTFAQKEAVATRLNGIKTMQDSMAKQERADVAATLSIGLSEGTTTREEVKTNPIISETQRATLLTAHTKERLAAQKKAEDMRQAQISIMRGEAVEKDQGNLLFDSAVKAQTAANAEALPQTEGTEGAIFSAVASRPSITQEAAMVLGTEGVVPVSGIPGVPMPNSVNKLDKRMSDALTSGDPAQQIDAITAYGMLLDKGVSMVNIQGKALDIAASAIGSMTVDAEENRKNIQITSDRILKSTELERSANQEYFNTVIKANLGVETAFKSATGQTFDPQKNSLMYSLFKQSYESHFVSSGNTEGAQNAAAQDMKLWSKSKYSTKSMKIPPDSLPIAQKGFALENQFLIATQSIINDNAERKAKGLPFVDIAWRTEADTINIESIDEDQRWRKPLKSVTEGTFSLSKMPQVLINGRKTELSLMSGPNVVGPDGKESYVIQYLDPSNNLQPLPDTNPRSVTGSSRFKPMSFEEYAPAAHAEDEDARLGKEWREIRIIELERMKKEADSIEEKLLITQDINEIVKKIKEPTPEELRKLKIDELLIDRGTRKDGE